MHAPVCLIADQIILVPWKFWLWFNRYTSNMFMQLKVHWSPCVWACNSAVMWFQLPSYLPQNYRVGCWDGILDMLQLCPWLCACQRKQSFFSLMMTRALPPSCWPHIDLETEFHTTVLNQLNTAIPIWPTLIALMIRSSIVLGALFDACSVT